MSKTRSFNTKTLVFSGVAIALAVVIATVIKLPSLPMGGSVTLFSMLVITLVGYWYGPKVGLAAAVTYGILQFITGPYVVHPLQVLLDFPVAFGALGLSGFFHNAKHGLIKGFLVGCFGRFLVHCISGMIFYTAYVGGGDIGGNMVAIWAGVSYNMTYIVPEVVITLILLALPPVANVMKRLKTMAND